MGNYLKDLSRFCAHGRTSLGLVIKKEFPLYSAIYHQLAS